MNIFLTGGHSGIGKAFYDHFKKDHNIVAPSRSEYNLENFKSLNYDLSTTDALVLIAGQNFDGKKPFVEQQIDNVLKTIDVNFKSTVFLIHEYLDSRQFSKSSSKIIYVSSIAADHIVPNSIAYSASKLASEFIIRSLHKEISSDNLDITIIKPGLVKTNFANRNYGNRVPVNFFDNPHHLPEDYLPYFQLGLNTKGFAEYTLCRRISP